MKKQITGLSIALLLLFGGCGVTPGLGESDQVIPLSQVDQTLKKRLPVMRKASFGSVRVLSVALQPGSDKKSVEAVAKFILTSYEIPEGIEGLITYQAHLKYSPENRTLTLSQLKPLSLTFGNPSLEEYVSAAARQGVSSVVASILQGLPLQVMPENFRARKVKKFSIQKENLLIDFN